MPGFVAVAPTAEAITAAVDDRTAAVLLEPVQGEGGVHVLGDDVLRAARAACDAHGAALVFDEVQCGLGRTGRLWAYEHAGVVPDALTTAKALGGGLPIGALLLGERLADVLEPGDHGSTFAGGPVQAAAGLAVLDVVADEALLARVRAWASACARRWPSSPASWRSAAAASCSPPSSTAGGRAPERRPARAPGGAPGAQRDRAHDGPPAAAARRHRGRVRRGASPACAAC